MNRERNSKLFNITRVKSPIYFSKMIDQAIAKGKVFKASQNLKESSNTTLRSRARTPQAGMKTDQRSC